MLIEPAGTGVVGDGNAAADAAASGGADAADVGYVVSGAFAVCVTVGDTSEPAGWAGLRVTAGNVVPIRRRGSVVAAAPCIRRDVQQVSV